VLKKASVKLRGRRPGSYENLLSTLREFAEQHVREIESLYDYLRWLEARDPMAPRILFTYRVWGPTRMSDRWVEIAPDSPTMPAGELARMSTEIVLGIRKGGMRTYDYAYNEIGYDIYSSMDPEQLSGDATIEVPEGHVLARTARAAYEDCAIYFTEVRDSLRNILIDIEGCEEQRELMHSDAFWREFILKAVQTKKTETQLWDFKETLTIWQVKQQPERDRAKVSFAEDVASLANARGGVLVIGVSDQREILGLGGSSRDLENRLKAAREVIGKHIEYDREIVSFHQVVVPANDEERVCLVVIVAQAYEAVGVHDGEGRYTYPVRYETGIKRVSRLDLSSRIHMKSDHYDFMRELEQFVRDN